MSSAVLKEIKSVKHFVAGRIAASGSCDPSLIKNFADCLIQMIAACEHLGVSDGSDINDVLKDSPFGEEHTGRIMSAVDARMNEVWEMAMHMKM